MSWDQADAFTIDLQVQSEHIDELGHANNAVYVTWLERCAWQHSQSLGLGIDDYRRLDRAMAVLRHEIDYLAAALRTSSPPAVVVYARLYAPHCTPHAVC